MNYIHFRHKKPDYLLRYFNMSDPPFNITDIIQKLGIEITQVKQAGWSGACRLTNKNAKIWISLEESRYRQRFILAHELGHIILHPFNAEYTDWFNPYATDVSYKEKEANYFAINILMPEWSVRVAVDYIGANTAKLALHFDVSEYVMEMRLRELYC